MVGILAIRRWLAMTRWLRIVDVGGVVVEGRQRADRAAHDGHRVRVAAEARVEAGHLLVHHGVARDGVVEILELLLGRQLAVQQQVADLDEVGLLRQLFDRVAAIEQDALVAVDVGDAGRAVGRRGEARIVGEAAGVAVQPADVDDVRTDGSRSHRHLGLPVVAQRQLGGSWWRLPCLLRSWDRSLDQHALPGGASGWVALPEGRHPHYVVYILQCEKLCKG